MPVLLRFAGALVLVLAATPVSAQPVSPIGPGAPMAGRANTGPVTPNSPMARKWRTCNAAWLAEGARNEAAGPNAKIRFMETCMTAHRPPK